MKKEIHHFLTEAEVCVLFHFIPDRRQQAEKPTAGDGTENGQVPYEV